MPFRQIRLQTNRCLRRGTRFFLSRRCFIEIVISPIVDPCQSGKRSRELRIQCGCALEKLLCLFRVGAKRAIRAIEQFVGFNKGQIGFAIFGGPVLDLRLLHWREFRLQFAHNLLCEISLNGKHIG